MPCYPFISSDPFILDAACRPHVLFSGNAPAFATGLHRTFEGHVTRLVCVPSFERSGVAVLLNVDNLDVSTIDFGVH